MPSLPSPAERELDDLRARAYGPKPDIGADPAAIARLIELEAAHIGVETPVTAAEAVGSRAPDATSMAPPAHEILAAGTAAPEAKPIIPSTSRERFGRSLGQRALATRSRARLIVGSIVAVAILLYAATWLLPHPDATLRPTEVESDSVIFGALNHDIQVGDISTLRQFEPYHDINVWSVEDSSGQTCLIAWDFGGSSRYQLQCLPPGIELALHMRVDANDGSGFGDWLPDGSVVSFHLRENTRGRLRPRSAGSHLSSRAARYRRRRNAD